MSCCNIKTMTEQELKALFHQCGGRIQYAAFMIESGDYWRYGYYHEDYDGPGDNRNGEHKTLTECVQAIAEYYEELEDDQEPDPNNDALGECYVCGKTFPLDHLYRTEGQEYCTNCLS